MAESTIRCPKCGTQIELTETLAMSGIEGSLDEQRDMRILRETVRPQEVALREAVDERGATHELPETSAAEESYEIANLRDALGECEASLREARRAVTEMVRAQSAFENEKRELERTTAARIRDESSATRASALKEAADQFDLKMAEKEASIASLLKVVADLQLKAETVSRTAGE